MSIKNISRNLRRLKFSLYLLFTVLAAMSVYLVLLLQHSADQLDTVSAETSVAIVDSVIRREREAIGKLTKDYAFWNDAVANLALRLDPGFLQDNFIGSYMGDSFDISRVVIAHLDKTIALSIVDGEIENSPDQTLTNDVFQSLMQQALQADMRDPKPVTGFIKIGNALHIVACVPITPNNDQDHRLEFGRAYGLLLMTKKLDAALIDSWARDFKLDSARLQYSPQLQAGYLARPLMNPLHKELGIITWQAERPGNLFLSSNAKTLSVFLILLLVITLFFSFNIRRYISLSLLTAKQLEHSEHELNQLAYYDHITGLPNRSLAMDRLAQSLKAIHRNNSFTAVMFIDLDGFKPVNDIHGHATGDQVLAGIGMRLMSCIRQEDTLARVGGDEFLVILTALTSVDHIEDVAQKILRKIEHFSLDGDKQVQITASIGIAIAPRDGREPEDLVACADQAMYCSKFSGKNQYQFFSDIIPT